MPEQPLIGLAIALVTALLSVASTYVALVTRIRRDLEAQYDRDLRERRLAAYSRLWALTEPLAIYSPARALTPQGVRAMSKRLRHWYFTDGMVLSEAARGAYFAFQEMLTADGIAAAPARTDALAGRVLSDLQEASSALRDVLSRDVASRRPPMIAGAARER